MSLTNEDTKNIIENKVNNLNITDFQVEQYIGKGGYGKVYTVTHNETGKTIKYLGEQYAMKIMKKSKFKSDN